MSTMYSIGLMNQLGDALERARFTPEDVTRLRSFPRLGEFKNVSKGLAEIVMVKHIIDCDADPFLPNGWKVESHKKGGSVEWDPTKVKLHLSPNQQADRYIIGVELQKELASLPVLNANILDYLLDHPGLIPENWDGKSVYFWGTNYRDPIGDPYVRCLQCENGFWISRFDWLGNNLGDSAPAAVLASS